MKLDTDAIVDDVRVTCEDLIAKHCSIGEEGVSLAVIAVMSGFMSQAMTLATLLCGGDLTEATNKVVKAMRGTQQEWEERKSQCVN